MSRTAKSIFVDPSSASRLSRASGWLAERQPGEELLVIGATLDAANDLIRNHIGDPPGSAIGAVASDSSAAFGWHRASLGQLAFSIASPALAMLGIAAVTPLSVQAVVARVLQRLGEEGGLGRYQPIRDLPGFPVAVADTLTELRLAGVTAARLQPVAPELGGILESYRHELAQSAITDRAGVIEAALTTFTDASELPALAGLPLLVLDTPVATTLEARLLAALVERSPEVLFTMPSGDTASLRRLRGALGGRGLTIEATAGPGDDPLRRLQHALFRDVSDLDYSSPGDAVTVLSAPGENRECVEIARRALQLGRDGVAFDRMAVLLRAPRLYRAPLVEALDRADIPAHFARGTVRPDPSGRALLALLACAAEHLSARRFAEYLSLGEMPDADDSGRPPPARAASERIVAPDDELVPRAIADALTPAAPLAPTIQVDDPEHTAVAGGRLRAPRRWERLLVDAVVIGGRERWTKRLAGLANELQSRLEAQDDDDAPGAVGIRRDVDALAALRDYALPLLESLEGLPRAASWREWIEHLSSIATRALRHPDRVLSVLAELVPMATVGPVDLQQVRLVLSKRLVDLTLAPASNRYGRIFVAPIEAARGMCFDVVFVPGLAERVFPAKIGEEPILLDEARQRLDANLATNDDRIARERSALHDALGAARKHLVLSYPRLDLEQGRPRVPSFYALEVLRAAEGRLPDFRELATRAETAADARVGWPAPADPALAIDEAEHDLALLDALLRLDPEQSIGTARYLLGVNPHLGRALRFRARRWLRRWTPADGLVDPSPAGREAVRAHWLDVRSYSATALQTYAECPYKFLLYAVHRLAPRDEAIAHDEMDPLSRGSLIHDAQFALYARLRELDLLPLDEGNLDRAQAILDEVLDTVAGDYRERFAPAIDRMWRDGIAGIRGDLREWMRRTSSDASGFVPWRFELAFGLSGPAERDPHSVAEPIDLACGITLRGAIDLVERHREGRIRVTDHKTGKDFFNRAQIVAGGTSLQPLLYALAAERLFPNDTVEAGRLYFCTSRGSFAEHSVALNDDTRESAKTLADTIREALQTPFLPAAPASRRCEWCDYQVVCGPYEELRTQRKPRDRLEPLLRLREMQ